VLTLDSPLSLFAIPILFATVQYPHFAKGALIAKSLGHFNNVTPRNNVERCAKKEVPHVTIEKMERMQAAHMNGNEGFALWAISIVAANLFGVETRTNNLVAGGLIIGRVLYNYLYINNPKSRTMAALRSLTWISGIGASFTLLILSANRFAAKGQ